MSTKSLRILVIVSMMGSMYGMNITNLTDAYIKPYFHEDKRFQWAGLIERGFSSKAFDECGLTNPLRIWNADQNSLKMLEGFPADSAIGRLRTLIDADDNGVRGHYLVNGCLALDYNINVALRYRFYCDFILGVYLPIMGMRLNNVAWFNQTLDITAQDIRVREDLTDNFFANVAQLGGLYLQDWRRAGFGDTTLLLEWLRDFPQAKPVLKNVHLNGRLGLIFPTGLKQNEDLIFALPFGHDGAYGLLFAAGLDLTLSMCVKAGVDVQLTHFFGNSKIRRIKTHTDQTELLLLQKACAFKNWGLIQQFNLYGQLFHLYKGWSFKVNYQFLKQGESSLVLATQDFSNHIANTARSLEDWTAHNAIFELSYDWCYCQEDDAALKPQLVLYAKAPFNGKRSALFGSVGAMIALDF